MSLFEFDSHADMGELQAEIVRLEAEVARLKDKIDLLTKERNGFKASLLRAITCIASCDRCKNLAPRIHPFPLSDEEGGV